MAESAKTLLDKLETLLESLLAIGMAILILSFFIALSIKLFNVVVF